MAKQRETSGTTSKTGASDADNGVGPRHQNPRRAAPLSTANAEESPRMDRGDSAGGAGESLEHGRDDAAKSLRRGALDTQYGTKSSMKGGGPSAAPAAATADTSKHGDRDPQAPSPDSPEDSSGAGRDTMGSSRPGSGS